ncbi:MAG TPA: transglycosylase family protein [Candidatus Saccharimonadales bacterium]|nr:transglycosylase family protein [Candidatus Saccharimonadales bacterium]
MDYIYPSPMAEAIESQPPNKPKRWKKLGVATVATLLSAGAVAGVATTESDNSPIHKAPAMTQEFYDHWQKLAMIKKENLEAKWFKHVYDEAVENGLKFSFAIAVFAAKANESHQSYVPPSNSSSSVSTPSYNGNVEAFLACTRGHESDTAGGYQAVSPDGVYHGAYQFDQSTWNSVAANNGRPDLVGQDPAQVSPTDQDKMATDLYEERGNQPWGGRC